MSRPPLPPLLAAQSIFKKLGAGPSKPPPRMSIESGPFTFHYIIDGDVCYLVLTDKAYPKKLAFQYLEELQSEFTRLYGTQIEGVARPYAFIKFGERRAGRGGARRQHRAGEPRGSEVLPANRRPARERRCYVPA